MCVGVLPIKDRSTETDLYFSALRISSDLVLDFVSMTQLCSRNGTCLAYTSLVLVNRRSLRWGICSTLKGASHLRLLNPAGLTLIVQTRLSSFKNTSAPFNINECKSREGLLLSTTFKLLVFAPLQTDDAHWNRAPYGPWGITECAFFVPCVETTPSGSILPDLYDLCLADPDFKPSNIKNATCELPLFWDTTGAVVNIEKGPGCYDSPFGQSHPHRI